MRLTKSQARLMLGHCEAELFYIRRLLLSRVVSPQLGRDLRHKQHDYEAMLAELTKELDDE